ncbi:DUF4279 domain-containing protein [Sorangium cellulosum]|uniref:DUF4279 domain-containing protein n=1 Tax=Sorangium TaxID=39643 RepID=UPI0009D66236|nr:DUF4279 domain-containing protein [Sorangium cellulosum]
MSVRNHVRLKIITRSVTPEEITARLGLNPDRVRRAGQPRPHTTIIENTNCWELHSGLPEHCELSEHISAVLRKVERCAKQIAEMAEENEVLLSCIVHAPTEPALGLSKKIIRDLADICAEVDFDLYVGEE